MLLLQMSGLYSEVLDRLDKAKRNLVMEEWVYAGTGPVLMPLFNKSIYCLCSCAIQYFSDHIVCWWVRVHLINEMFKYHLVFYISVINPICKSLIHFNMIYHLVCSLKQITHWTNNRVTYFIIFKQIKLTKNISLFFKKHLTNIILPGGF